MWLNEGIQLFGIGEKAKEKVDAFEFCLRDYVNSEDYEKAQSSSLVQGTIRVDEDDYLVFVFSRPEAERLFGEKKS